MEVLKQIAKDFCLSALAGICIAIGGTVYLCCSNQTVGVFLFSLGLLTIIFFKLNLFTGKVGYLLSEKPSYLLFLIVVWLGNAAGAIATALLEKHTRISSALTASAQTAADIKSSDSLLSLFILGIFCGIMVYIAVQGTKSTESGAVKVTLTVLPIAVFIFCGFEHCIADIYYFALVGFTPSAWLRILIITLGNSVGAIVFHLLSRLALPKADSRMKSPLQK